MPVSVPVSQGQGAFGTMQQVEKFGEDRRSARLQQTRDAMDIQKIEDDNAMARKIEAEIASQFNAAPAQQQAVPQQKPYQPQVQQPNAYGMGAGQIADTASSGISQVSLEQLNAPTQRTVRPQTPDMITADQVNLGITGSSQQNVGAAPQQGQISTTPFDSPDFLERIAKSVAGMRGSSSVIMGLKSQRDSMLSKIMEMIGNGATDEARWVAQKNGFQIPEQIYKNSDVAAAMSFANKAYPNEPDKSHQFFQSFINANGQPFDQRVQLGLQSAGAPSNAAQRQLSNAIALYKAQTEMKRNEPQPYVGAGGQLNYVTPSTMTAQPVMTAEGTPFVTQVKTVGSGAPGSGLYRDPATGQINVTPSERQRMIEQRASYLVPKRAIGSNEKIIAMQQAAWDQATKEVDDYITKSLNGQSQSPSPVSVPMPNASQGATNGGIEFLGFE